MLCKTCKHGIVCYTWGECKCTLKFFRIDWHDEIIACADYEKDTSGKERKCHCEACQELEGGYEE